MQVKAMRFHIILILTLIFSPVCSAEWRRYESNSFEVISDERESSVTEWINELETVKALTELLFQSEIADSDNSKLKIFIFNRLRDFREFYSDPDLAGFYIHGINKPYMIIGPNSQKTVLFHEFGHYSMSHGSENLFPTWIEEGYAETLSTISIMTETVIFGAAPSRVSSLSRSGPVSIERLLIDAYPENPKQANAYYATAWVLFKILQLSDDEKFVSSYKNYLTSYRSGERDPQRLVESFQTTRDELDSIIERAIRRPRGSVLELVYELPLTEIAKSDSSISISTIGESEIELIMASYFYDISDYRAIIRSLNPQGDRSNLLANAFYAVARSRIARSIDQEYFVDLVQLHSPNLEELIAGYSEEEKSMYFALVGRYFYDFDKEMSQFYALKALNLDTNNVEALLLLSMIHAEKAEYDKASNFIHKAVSINFRNGTVIKTAALMALIIEDNDLFQNSINMWKSIYKHNEDAALYNELLSAFDETGKHFIALNPKENSPNNIEIISDILRLGNRLSYDNYTEIVRFNRFIGETAEQINRAKIVNNKEESNYERILLSAIQNLYGAELPDWVRQNFDLDHSELNQNYAKAFEKLVSLHEYGFAESLFLEGIMHRHGFGIVKDAKIAFELFQQANNAQYSSKMWELITKPNLIYELAKIFEEGIVVDQDYPHAVELYTEASIIGSKKAQQALSTLYEIGRGVPQNYLYAYSWHAISVNASNSDQDKAVLEELADFLSSSERDKASEIIETCISSNLRECALVIP